MRIVSFNIQHGLGPGGVVDAAALASYCAELRGDVIGLQEVDVGARRSGRVDQAESVALATGMTKVFGRAHRIRLRGSYGNVLLVRGTLADVDPIVLPRMSRHEPRAAIIARAALAEGELSLAVTHLSVDPHESRAQLEAVLAAVSKRPLPRVVLGDLNLRAEDVADAFTAAGLSLVDPVTPTFPAVAPRARIDHVAVAGLKVLGVKVLPAAPVSDHRPLLVEVADG